MDTVTPTEPVVWWLTIENNGLSWVAIEISSDMVVIFSTKVGFGGDKTAIVDSPEVALLAGMTYDLMFYPGGKKGSWALLTEQMMIAMPPVAAFDFSPAEPQAGAPVTFDASASSDPDGTIVSYDWDFGDGSMGSGVVVEHTYAMAGDYSVTLTVTDSQGLHSTTSKVVTVIAPPVMRTLDVTFFDFFDTPFGDYWLSREIWGDSIFHNTYPYIHMYQHPFFTGNVYELYGGAKMRAVGQNLGELTIDAPLFFPLLGDTGIPGGLVDLSYRLTYPDPARLADLDCVYFRCRKTLGTSDDGWISEWRGNLTMDRATAAKVLSLPEGQDVASWWMTNELPVEDAWFFYLDAEGNGRLDIFNAFEWPYDNFVVDLDLYELPDGRVNLEVVDIISWGNEVLFNRWMYWGHASPNYLQGVRDGFFPYGEYWYDNLYLNLSIGPEWTNADIFTWVWYALQALDIPGVGLVWQWGPFLMDYIYSSSAHPSSTLDAYAGMTEMKWTPGSNDWGTEGTVIAVPNEWQLRAGDSLTFTLPDIDVLGVEHVANGKTQLVPGVLDFGSSLPDLSGNYDSTTKTLRIVGPYDFTTESVPLSHPWPQIQYIVGP